MPAISNPPVQSGDQYVIRHDNTATTTATDYTFANTQDTVTVFNLGSRNLVATANGVRQVIEPNDSETFKFVSIVTIQSLPQPIPFRLEGRTKVGSVGDGTTDVVARNIAQSAVDAVNDTVTQLTETATNIYQFNGANDLARLQAAIDGTPSNGKLILKQGASYTISGQLNLKSNITIDANKATITQTLANTPIFKGIDTSNVTVYNAILYGHGNDFVAADNRLAVGIYIKGVTSTVKNIDVNNNELYNFTHAGVYLEKVQQFKVNKNRIKGTGAAHLVTGTNYQFGITPRINCQFGEIKDNEISFTAHGIYASHEQTDTVIEGNDIHDIIGQHGMYLTNGTNLKVVKNSLTRIAYHGIKFQLDTNNVSTKSKTTNVSGNTFNTCGLFGISFENVDVTTVAANRGYFESITISDNTIVNAASGGISLRHCKDVICSKNIYDGVNALNTSYGIFLRNVQDVTIDNNTLRNMGWSGIYFSDDSAGVLYPCSGVFVTNNKLYEYDQLASSSHSGLYILGNYPNLTIDNNYLSDKNALAYMAMFLVNTTTAVTARINNNNFVDRPIRFQTGLTAVGEFDNNKTTSITGYPALIIKGRKAAVFHGTRAIAPTSSTGFVNGDRYEYTDPVAAGYIGKILVGGVWKDFGQILA